MNRETSLNPAGGGFRAFAEDPNGAEQKSTREQAERWALAVGGEIARVSQIAMPTEASSETTSGWRGGAGDLTRVADGASAGGGPQEAGETNENSAQRLTLSVDGGDLGALSLVVDRRQGAISVTIGVRDSAAEAAVGLERRALEQALAGHGITVDSVRIVRADALGIVLAPSRPNAKQRTRPDDDGVLPEPEKRRLARKLNLIG
ncbi:MAG TPA: hypothetical protein VGI10_17030 [Polyangiaceae bacterium]|jgi:hypothetical protein